MATSKQPKTSIVGPGRSNRRPQLPDWLEKRRGKFDEKWPNFFRPRPNVIKFWKVLASRIDDFESSDAFRLFEAIESGMRLSGSKTQNSSKRRDVGKKIASNASKLAALIRPTEVPGYIPGFAIDDPLQKIIHEPIEKMLNKFIDQMINGGWLTPEPEGREAMMLRAGAKYAIWHLHESMEILARSGEKWAATPPMQSQLSGLRSLRRSVLFEVCRYMITFTGSRRPTLEASAVNILFEDERTVSPLGTRRREVDEAMSKSQIKSLTVMLASKKAMESARKEWLKDPKNSARLERIMRGENRRN